MKRLPLADLPDWPGLMRAPEAAAYLSISEEAFRKHVAPRLRAVKVTPGSVSWARRDLDRLIAGGGESDRPLPTAGEMNDVETARREWDIALGATG